MPKDIKIISDRTTIADILLGLKIGEICKVGYVACKTSVLRSIVWRLQKEHAGRRWTVSDKDTDPANPFTKIECIA